MKTAPFGALTRKVTLLNLESVFEREAKSHNARLDRARKTT